MSLVRTFGHAMLGAIAVPVTALSGLATLIFLLVFIFSSQYRWLGFVMAVFFGVICWCAYKVLSGIYKKASQLIDSINAKEGLQLSSQHLLGTPPGVYAFDSQHRKLAVCNTATGDYRIRDFSFIRSWRTDSRIGVKTEMGMGGERIGNTVLHGPKVTERQYETGFALVLTVADMDQPMVRFPMRSADEAERWCARLEAILNG